MADANIKKIIIRQSELPPLNTDEEKYVIRFRIVSEDKNRVSHWSPQYLLEPKPLELADDDRISVTSGNGILAISWEELEPGSVAPYDVWVAWGTQSGSTGLSEFKATVSGNYVTIPIPDGKVSAQVFVQNMTVPRKQLPSLVVAQTSVLDLNVV